LAEADKLAVNQNARSLFRRFEAEVSCD
jgi:hypothetical protein